MKHYEHFEVAFVRERMQQANYDEQQQILSQRLLALKTED